MGSEARTRLGLAGVLAVTLLTFNQLFAPGDYPGPALLGMLLAGGLVIGARRAGLGNVPSLLASLAGLMWYVAFVFETQATLFGLPTPASLAGAARAIGRAYSFSHIDYAPVPVRPGYVILLVAGMWVATALGELATFRWKRPLLAAVPAVALFSLAIVLGTGQGGPVLVVLFLTALLTFWGLESSHRVRAWGRWVTAWSPRGDAEPDAITGTIARRMGAGCVALAVVAPLFLPALGDGLLSWRNDVSGGLGRGGGGSGGGRIDPLVSIAPSLVNQSAEELFRVEAGTSTYWRLVALPNFDGETWSPADADEEREVGADGALGGPWAPAEAVRTLDHEIMISGLRGRYLPGAVHPVEVDLNDSGRSGDLRLHPETGDVSLEGGVAEGLAYRVRSAAPDPSFRDLRDARPGESASVYTSLPALDSRVEELRDEWIEGYITPYEKLVAIQEALRGGRYTYSTPRPDQIASRQQASNDLLTTFLLETKTGYCQQFATAFAALSRSLGYPTRVVVGFLPGEVAAGDKFVVRGTDAHAWPEVFFEGYGWVRFEPTPRIDTATAIVPDYTTPSGADPAAILGNDGGLGLALRQRGAGASDVRRLNDPGVGGRSDALARQEGRSAGSRPGAGGTPEDARWRGTFRRLVLALFLATVAALVAVPALKARRIRRLYRGAAGARDITAAAFGEFMLEAGELAAPRGAAESARAYAMRVARVKHLPERQALRLAALYERAVYARSERGLDPGEARSLARDLRATLWRKASWWERGVRLFSPRTLIG